MLARAGSAPGSNAKPRPAYSSPYGFSRGNGAWQVVQETR